MLESRNSYIRVKRWVLASNKESHLTFHPTAEATLTKLAPCRPDALTHTTVLKIMGVFMDPRESFWKELLISLGKHLDCRVRPCHDRQYYSLKGTSSVIGHTFKN